MVTLAHPAHLAMEIQALLSAPPAKAAPTKAEPAGADEFSANLEEAQAAYDAVTPSLEGAPEPDATASVPTSETVSAVPTTSPPVNAALVATFLSVPAASAPTPTTATAAVTVIPPLPPAAPPAPTPMDAAKATELPEAPVPTEISVEVVDVRPMAPEAPKPTPEMVLTLATADPAPSEMGESDGEGADTPADTTSDTPRVEPKGEARLDAPLRLESTAKAEAPAREVRLDTHNVVRELANRIELMAAAKSQQGVIVHLQPLDLGSITLLVKPESGGVSAEIGASNDQVRQALAQSQPQLSRHLELRGLTVTNVSVSAETSNRDPQRQPSSQQQHPSFGSSQPGHSALPRASQYGSPDPVVHRRPARATGVDLWI